MCRTLSFGLIVLALSTSPLSAQLVPQEENSASREEASRLLKEATELAARIESPLYRSVFFVRLGETYWHAGDKASSAKSFDKGLKILDTLPQENPEQDLRDSYRASIAAARADANDIEGAQQM
ncbi:MAG: hypothetical protein LAN71_14570, partial [Acidobacteriia bacterium]|nr:hypothetical protein [Terriglobia bacterium]